MSDAHSLREESPLYHEHLLLGAVFDNENEMLDLPVCYSHPEDEPLAFVQGCALCDLTGMANVLVAGEDVEAFVRAACACNPPQVGSCDFSAVVTGDGSVASMPLVARTGVGECLLLDASERGLMLHPWLAFIANIEQGGFKPFEGIRITDETDSLVPLLLWGPQASAILGDYVASLDLLPQPGHVVSEKLDQIDCLLVAPPRLDTPCYLVLAPPMRARALWRSFLSFAAVEPVGRRALEEQLARQLPWASVRQGTGRLELALDQLLAWELARVEGGYIGERALLG